MKVGVLGGTFDPLHFGHLRAAEVARDSLGLDRVLFVPAANPPHKREDAVTDASHRVRMLDEALAGEEHFLVSRIELNRGGASYTIDTLGELRAKEPEAEYWFITGSDAFAEIRTWRSWKKLLTTYAFAVLERPGCNLRDVLDVVPEGLRERVSFLESAMLEVSSTEIRHTVREGKSIRFLVPDSVEAYVRRNRLYE